MLTLVAFFCTFTSFLQQLRRQNKNGKEKKKRLVEPVQGNIVGNVLTEYSCHLRWLLNHNCLIIEQLLYLFLMTLDETTFSAPFNAKKLPIQCQNCFTASVWNWTCIQIWKAGQTSDQSESWRPVLGRTPAAGGDAPCHFLLWYFCSIIQSSWSSLSSLQLRKRPQVATAALYSSGQITSRASV